jgi:Na+-transporting NADH:ubiquinone oxidoreductase subunit C
LNFSNKYIIGFAVVLCLVCSLAVSALAVALRPKQDANRLLDQQENILRVSGLWSEEGHPTPEQAAQMFASVITWEVDRASGAMTRQEGFVPAKRMIDAIKDPAASAPTASADAKGAQLTRTPNRLLVYEITQEGKQAWVLPMWGNGLWSTMYGFLSVKKDFSEVLGITFYQHGETPGLGGEIDNPRWKAQWPGKRLLGADGAPAVEVVKNGAVRDPARQVDGISGSTLTSRGVHFTVRAWLGDEGYGAWIAQQRAEAGR